MYSDTLVSTIFCSCDLRHLLDFGSSAGWINTDRFLFLLIIHKNSYATVKSNSVDRHTDRQTDRQMFSVPFTPCSNAPLTGRSHLRSAERRDVLVPWTRTQFDRRSFHTAALVFWNLLLAWLCSVSISRGQFRDWLKSHLFFQACT